MAIRRLENMLNDNEYIIKYFIPCFEKVMKMILKNIFMKIIVTNIDDNLNDLSIADTAVTTNSIIIDYDKSWPHFKGIFDILYKIIINSYVVVKLLEYVDKVFITKVNFIFKIDLGIIRFRK